MSARGSRENLHGLKERDTNSTGTDTRHMNKRPTRKQRVRKGRDTMWTEHNSSQVFMTDANGSIKDGEENTKIQDTLTMVQIHIYDESERHGFTKDRLLKRVHQERSICCV